MKGLLLDQGLPRSTVTLLHRSSIAAVHVGEIDLAAASDDEILEYARTKDLIVVTLDADFHMLLAAKRAISPSVIRFRQQGLKAPEITQLIRVALDSAKETLASGAVVSVTKGLIRFRKLPIGKRD
jgi:predicted nuclease of predicted toxin-antitoxin system